MAKSSKAKKTRSKKRSRSNPFTAATADRHELYQLSVQNPEQEIEVIEDSFFQRRGRKAYALKEDFCGTALLCSAWVASDPGRTAVGLDLDTEVLAWGKERNVAPLGADAARVKLLEQNVLEPIRKKVDVCVAMNFSYFIFTTRTMLKTYFQAARKSLVDDGILFLDCYGGWDCGQLMEEPRDVEAKGRKKAFTYVWDQAYFNPINNAAINHIHFRFKDGTTLEEAFTYEWRFWHLAEIVELLGEAGFRNVDVLFEDEDDDGDGVGTYTAKNEIENDPGWLCYIVAEN